jgi:DNA-directed RNA polymerase specialized sigma24 family protein
VGESRAPRSHQRTREPERERAIVSLRYGAGLNASEIASAVGIEPAAIRKILERARTRLGTRIEALLSPDGGLS